MHASAPNQFDELRMMRFRTMFLKVLMAFVLVMKVRLIIISPVKFVGGRVSPKTNVDRVALDIRGTHSLTRDVWPCFSSAGADVTYKLSWSICLKGRIITHYIVGVCVCNGHRAIASVVYIFVRVLKNTVVGESR
jgi:hypothetical protein